MSITSQYKICQPSIHLPNAQTYNPTLTSADVSLIWVAIQETDLKARGIRGNFDLEATTNTGVAFPLSVGNLAVMCVASVNAGSGGGTLNYPSSITDSVGNTWTLRLNALYDPAAANQGATGHAAG